jgi:transcription elongation factor GreA
MTNEVQVDSPARVTLGEALREYLATLKPEQRRIHEAYVRKYVEHTGEQVEISSLTGSKVESYAERQIRVSDRNAPERVQALKAWFQFLKKKNYANANFGVHIRVRKAAGRSGPAQVRVEEAPVEMTAEGLEQLKQELDQLNSRRPELVEAISLAREDKDFRENAPLDAAREALAFAEQRKKQIELALKRAVVVERATEDMSAIGSSVTVTHLDRNVQVTYRLVGGREANATDKKISVESPVGQQLLNRRVGDEVEVTAPQGTIRYRIDAISHK